MIQCARVAFGFAGIYDFDEGNDILKHGGKRVTRDGNIVDIEVEDIGGDIDADPEPPKNDVLPEEPDPTDDGVDAEEQSEEKAENYVREPEPEADGDEEMPW